MKKLLLFTGLLFVGFTYATQSHATETSSASSLQRENLSAYVSEEHLHLRGFDTSAPQSIAIYNAVGQALITINQSPELPIDISNIGKGIYFVKVGTIATLKFVKL